MASHFSSHCNGIIHVISYNAITFLALLQRQLTTICIGGDADFQHGFIDILFYAVLCFWAMCVCELADQI